MTVFINAEAPGSRINISGIVRVRCYRRPTRRQVREPEDRHTIIGWRIGPEPVTVDNFLLEVREPYKTGILYPDSQVVVSSDTLQGSSRAGHRQRRPSDTP